MKVLGLDHGEKNIGVAISDAMGMIARELMVVSESELETILPKLVMEEEISTVVLGMPYNMSGGESEQTLIVREFKKKLSGLVSVPVVLQDERLSSQMAATELGVSGHHDATAAKIILQNYLDNQANFSI